MQTYIALLLNTSLEAFYLNQMFVYTYAYSWK